MFVRAVGTALTNSPSSLSRIPFGKLKFFDSKFVKDRLKRKILIFSLELETGKHAKKMENLTRNHTILLLHKDAPLDV